MKEGGESFLNEKYPDLQHSSEVESVVKRQEVRTGEKAKNKGEKVEMYLDRLEEVFTNPGDSKRERKNGMLTGEARMERRIDILKNKLHELFVVKPDEIPESYFNHQKRIAREQGHGDIEITDQMRAQMVETITYDQAQSLDAWVDYLGSGDATYPNWLKYFAFRSITKLSEYDKDKKEFKKRSKGTTAPFPDINREALAYVLDAVEKSHKKEVQKRATDEQWEKLLKTANFGKLYGYAIEKVTPASEEEREQIQGEWIKYEQGSNAEPLYKSLQGHGTGWCTAGEGVAKTQLEAGDFYVFYSHTPVNGSEEVKKIPRVAIRMENGEIAEVRGINADQNLEPVMTDVAKDKVKELPGAEKYEKKVSDMKRLTEIEKKFVGIEEIRNFERKKNEKMESWGYLEIEDYDESPELEGIRQKLKEVELTKEELKFLYEIDGKIDGFGYEKDPRIFEIINIRDLKKDYTVIFDCKPEQVAYSQKEVNDQTIVCLSNIDFLRMTLPKGLKFIGGEADFSGSKIEDLKQLQMIGGDANFINSNIKNFGELQRIGRDVYIDRDSELDLSRIKIGGKIFNGDM